MRVIEVELKNICQHKYLKAVINNGITAIVGPNGSGKTNLLTAIYSGITGDFSRFQTNKSGIISQYAKPKDKAFIRVVMEHHGTTAEFYRGIQPNTRYLTVNKEEPITAEKEIAAYVEKWFGIPLKIIGQYVFVPQWEMFSILNEQPSDRAKDLYRLFNIDKAEKCYSAITTRLNKLSTINISISIDEEAIVSRLLVSRERLRQLSDTISDISAKVASIDDSPDNARILEEMQIRETNSNQLTQNTLELQVLNNQIEDEQLKLSDLTNNRKTVKANILKYRSELNKFTEKLIEYETYSKFAKSYIEITKAKASIESELNKIKSVKIHKPDRYIEECIDFVDKNLKDINSKIFEYSSLLNKLGGNDDKCPVCGNTSEVFLSKVAEAKQNLPELIQKVDDLKNDYKLSRDYDSRVAKLNESIELNTKRLLSLDEMSSSLPAIDSVQDPSKQISECKYNIANSEKLLASLNSSLQSCVNTINSYLGKKAHLLSVINKCEEVLSKITVTDTEIQYVRNLHKTKLEYHTKLAQAQAEHNVIARSIKDDEKTLVTAKENKIKLARYNNWKTLLTSVKDQVFHRDTLPKMVAQSYLKRLETEMNSHLIDLGVDFSVKTSDSLGFKVNFIDGRSLPAEALSGGEKVVFALAWRLSVYSQFANNIGMLCMDEPTAGLDKDRIMCLQTTINNMKKLATSKGLQCLVITHSEQILPFFDNKIDLRPESVKDNV